MTNIANNQEDWSHLNEAACKKSKHDKTKLLLAGNILSSCNGHSLSTNVNEHTNCSATTNDAHNDRGNNAKYNAHTKDTEQTAHIVLNHLKDVLKSKTCRDATIN